MRTNNYKTLTKRAKSGQTLVEYALVILVVIGIYAVMNRSILKGVGKLWKGLASELAAACPDCDKPDVFN